MTEQFPHTRSDNVTQRPAEAGGAPAPEPASTLSAAGLPLPKNWLAVIAFIWAGQAVSMITSYAAGYAVVWYVTESTGSALALAVMNIAVMLPIGLISPFGGVVADKHNRKLIMIAADGAVGVISLVAALLILAGDVSIPLLLAVCVARAVGQAFHSPAMMAAMPMLVPDKHLLRINTLDQLLASVASIGAPAFGIFLYTTLGFSSVMFLDFAGACVAILGLALAKIPTVVDASAETQHVLANLADGWRAIAKTRGLVLLIAGVTVGMMIFGPLSAVCPLMTYDYFGGDGYAASIVEGAFGVGMLVGSGILIAWGGGKRLAGLIAVAAVIVGATTAACGLLPSSAFPAFVGLMALMAVACAWFNGPTMTLTQRNVPDDKMGRAMGLLTAAMGLATPVGVAIGGVLAEVMGIAPFFLVDGLACLALGLVLYLPKSVRALDEG
ncbi:MFS transporter [Adlercreutzia sp. R7]|uniref:MFS transporter n=1 Tax=Adlercreutzia wanghongyangiae TaxID=3111451 RepID=A0ABU6IEY6_9ACTN|nr:MFS transporter [Adlercreutzia sp. R7]